MVSGPRLGTSIVFFLHGLASGLWVSRIPTVQEELGLGVGALGLSLLGGGVGTLLAMLPTGALVARHGSRAIVRGTGVAAAASVALLAAPVSGPTLFAAMVVWGAAGSALDVAMNAQGSAVETRQGRPVMSSLHGLWSLGGMAGAALGAGLAGLGVGFRLQLLGAAPFLLVALLLAQRSMLHGDEGQPGQAVFVMPRGALLALAVIAFCAVTTEGAMFEWGGVFLRRVLAASEVSAASAASFFQAAMAAGRLGGDVLRARMPAPHLARLCALCAGLGVLAVAVAPAQPFVFAGLVVAGLGLSVLVPLAFGAAGQSRDVPAGTAIAAVATMSYAAFLVGPPVIGLVAEQVTLRGSFALLLGLLALVALLARSVGKTG